MPNRLARETSPYLLQHKDNPVDWYPWGAEAFARARAEDKPVLLSVGYSSCHWCHVMEHESFEDPETAAVMNELFVSVKVDREERPDVDAVYMTAVQTMSGHGGWPMTVFLTPDGEPFYGGTYYPNERRGGMPAFREVLTGVSRTYREKRADVTEQAGKLTAAIARRIATATDLPDDAAFEAAYEQFRQTFDAEWGGFGRAPKFPQPANLDLLLRLHAAPFARDAVAMVELTVTRMLQGGIHDHLGGGFARYSVDRMWLVPHFEKMLYDNALLLGVLGDLSVLTGNEMIARAADHLVEWLVREMRQPGGGFSSAQDADSEGHEGKFFVWTVGEFDEVLGADSRLAKVWWGVTPQGNFEGMNVLHTWRDLDDVARAEGIPVEEAAETLERARAALFHARAARVAPDTDTKVVTSWNGLLLSSLAREGVALGRPAHVDLARDLARFLLENLLIDVGGRPRLARTWRDGQAKVPAFLEDYAALAGGLLDLYAATGESEWFEAALELGTEMLDLFSDPEGGFFDTARDAESLITRPRDPLDGATPAGNSLAADVAVRLALLTGDGRWAIAAEGAFRAAGSALSGHPTAFARLLGAYALWRRDPKEVAVAGPADDPRTASLLDVVRRAYRPDVVLAHGAANGVPLLAGRDPVDGKPAAYVCRHFACERPVTDPADLAALLG